MAPSTKRASHRTRSPLAQRGTVSLERPSTSWKRSPYARSMRALCGKDQALSCICQGKECVPRVGAPREPRGCSNTALCWCVWMCVVGLWVVSGGEQGAQISYAHIKRNHLGRPCRLQKEHGRMTRHESQLTNCCHGPTSSNIPTQPFVQEASLGLLQSGRENAPLPMHAVTHTQALGRFCQSLTKAFDASVACRRTSVSSSRQLLHCPHEAKPGSHVCWVLPAEQRFQCKSVVASARDRHCQTLGVRVLRCHEH